MSQEHEPGEEGESSMADVAEMGAPMLPAILFIASLILLVASFFTGNISNRLKITLFGQVLPDVMQPTVRVWVNKDNGTFDCDGSVLYGNGQGKYMAQADVLDRGYQPALGTYCQGGNSAGGASRNRARRANDAGYAAGEPAGTKSHDSAASPR